MRSWMANEFINFWNKLTSGSSKEVVGKPAEVKPVAKKQDIIGIIVGHNSKAQGAVNYKGETEFAFNTRIANKMKDIIDANPDFDCVIYNREPGSSFGDEIYELAQKIKKDNCLFTMELHFNSGPTGARGCEILVHTKNMLAIRIADAITDQLEYKFGIRQRDQDGVKELKKGDRGAYNITALEDIGVMAALLVEPCFANVKTAESQKIFDNEDLYAKVLAEEMIIHAKKIYK